MKKMIACTGLIVVLASGMYAAGAKDVQTVEGKLSTEQGMPLLVGKDSAGKEAKWILPPAPFYRIAWEKGLKLGDTVKAEGLVREMDEDCEVTGASMLFPAKVWVNGKELDLSSYDAKDNFRMGMGKAGAEDRNGMRHDMNGGRNPPRGSTLPSEGGRGPARR